MCIWFICWCIPRPCSPRHLCFIHVGSCLGDEPEPELCSSCVPAVFPGIVSFSQLPLLGGWPEHHSAALQPELLQFCHGSRVPRTCSGLTAGHPREERAFFSVCVTAFAIIFFSRDGTTDRLYDLIRIDGKLMCFPVTLWVRGLAGPFRHPSHQKRCPPCGVLTIRALTTVNEDSGADSFKRLSCQTWLIAAKSGMPTLLPRWILPNQAHFPAGLVGRGAVLRAGEQVFRDMCMWRCFA